MPFWIEPLPHGFQQQIRKFATELGRHDFGLLTQQRQKDEERQIFKRGVKWIDYRIVMSRHYAR